MPSDDLLNGLFTPPADDAPTVPPPDDASDGDLDPAPSEDGATPSAPALPDDIHLPSLPPNIDPATWTPYPSDKGFTGDGLTRDSDPSPDLSLTPFVPGRDDPSHPNYWLADDHPLATPVADDSPTAPGTLTDPERLTPTDFSPGELRRFAYFGALQRLADEHQEDTGHPPTPHDIATTIAPQAAQRFLDPTTAANQAQAAPADSGGDQKQAKPAEQSPQAAQTATDQAPSPSAAPAPQPADPAVSSDAPPTGTPDQVAATPAAPSPSAPPVDPVVGDRNTPPAYKKDVFAAQPGAWEQFNGALDSLKSGWRATCE